MVRELAFKDIESVIFEMIDYCEAPNGKAFFENGVWPLALSAKELEATIKTHNEFKEDKAIPEEHSPMRLAVFLLNHYGEYALNGRSITIFGDDPEIASPTKVAQHAHNNTYRLRLKDTQTHETLFPGNPSVDSAPYDFDAEFMKQETLFSNGSVKDTTATA